MSNRVFGHLIMILIALVLAMLILIVAASRTHASESIDAGTNQIRVEHGLPALDTWQPLVALADLRAHEIVVNFSHPSSWQYLFDRLPSCVTGLGENLAWITEKADGAWAVNAWYASPEHRANMLGQWNYQASQLLYANGRTYAVQLFAAGCTTRTAPTAVPAPAPTTRPTKHVVHKQSAAPKVVLPNTSIEAPNG